MAERATIARPYAKAAFEYASQTNAFAAWSTGLERLALAAADARVAELIANPEVRRDQLASMMADLAGGSAGEGMANFVHVLADNHRLALLPEIAAQYEALRAEAENTVDVELVSAVALSDAQSEKFQGALAQRFKRQVRMHYTIDESLLGGAVVRAGDTVIDGSLKGRLERLATNLAG